MFGTKSSRDFKKLSPFAEKINEKFKLLENLSNDQQGKKTNSFKKLISDSIQIENKDLDSL